MEPDCSPYASVRPGAFRPLWFFALCFVLPLASIAQEEPAVSADAETDMAEMPAAIPSDAQLDEAAVTATEPTPASPERGVGETSPESDFEPEALNAVNAHYRERIDADSEAAPSESPEQEPERAQGFSAVLQAFAALCVLCGIIILLGYLARTVGKRTPLLAGQRYGTVLGRVSLTPRASLHFVRAADRVLVLGVTQQSVTLVSEFPQDAFAQVIEDEPETPEPSDFIGELRRAGSSAKPEPDEELSALRGDLQRLQRYLKQHASGPDA